MTIDFNRPIQTRDGRPVRILCTDKSSYVNRSVVGLVRKDDGEETVYCWNSHGTSFERESSHNDVDLINVPEEIERTLGYVNVYRWKPSGKIHISGVSPRPARHCPDPESELLIEAHPVILKVKV